MKKKEVKIVRVRVQYNTKPKGEILREFEEAVKETMNRYRVVFDGTGMDLTTWTRDMFWYEPKEPKRREDGKRPRS